MKWKKLNKSKKKNKQQKKVFNAIEIHSEMGKEKDFSVCSSFAVAFEYFVSLSIYQSIRCLFLFHSIPFNAFYFLCYIGIFLKVLSYFILSLSVDIIKKITCFDFHLHWIENNNKKKVAMRRKWEEWEWNVSWFFTAIHLHPIYREGKEDITNVDGIDP